MNDTELISKILNGDQQAFTFLIEKYQNLVLHMIVRMVNREEDIEDICQDVFIKVFRNLDKFRGDAKLSTWIAKIAYNVGITHVRKNERNVLNVTDDFLTHKEMVVDTIPDNILENKELKALIMKEINELPVTFRSIATLYYLEEFSYQDIEEITGIKQSTLRTYMLRARAILKEKLIFELKNGN